MHISYCEIGTILPLISKQRDDELEDNQSCDID